MEHFIVSARKYRPQTFQEVVGQQAITNTLENAIQNNHLAQALLFTGPRGVGKTSCARILAKMINAHHGKISDDEDFAFNIFELDAASNNSVDDIRSLTEQVRIPPQTGNYKVYIIDEVHMLSQNAFNAFLKTLEEPPAHAIFILATTEKHKIIPTILSRCQIFDFKRIGISDAKNYLKTISEKEGITAEDDALHIIAQKADGAMRDALSIFDRVVSFSGKNLTREAVTSNLNVLDYETYFKITDLVLKNKIPDVLVAFNTILSKGFEGHHFINGLANHFRDLLVSKDKSTISLLEVGDRVKKNYETQSTQASISFLIQAIEKANDCDLNYKISKNKRLLVELTLMQIASITFDGEKKKRPNFIIPATFFTAISPAPKKTIDVRSAPKIIHPQEDEKLKNFTPLPQTSLEKSKKTPILKTTNRRRSSLSLNSIHDKPQIKKETFKEDYSKHPKDAFTQAEILKHVQSFYKELVRRGEKSLASILVVEEPQVGENFEIVFSLPNKLMAEQLQRNKHQVVQFLREAVNNYSLSIRIDIEETIEKKFVYTPQEKFNKLKEINPNLEKFHQIFELNL